MLVLKLREMVGWLYAEKQTEIFGKREIIWQNTGMKTVFGTHRVKFSSR